MSEAWEVVISFKKEESAQKVAAHLMWVYRGKVSIRKVNPDAIPVADQE